MDVLWDRGRPATVRDVVDTLHSRALAYTTVMTVLDRLAGKGMVRRERAGRAWSYRPAAAREAYIAQLMLNALDLAGSRDAALVRFARSVTGPEADVLRAALADHNADVDHNADADGGAAADDGRDAGSGGHRDAED
jgi:predicted transcriptional regulator